MIHQKLWHYSNKISTHLLGRQGRLSGADVRLPRMHVTSSSRCVLVSRRFIWQKAIQISFNLQLYTYFRAKLTVQRIQKIQKTQENHHCVGVWFCLPSLSACGILVSRHRQNLNPRRRFKSFQQQITHTKLQKTSKKNRLHARTPVCLYSFWQRLASIRPRHRMQRLRNPMSSSLYSFGHEW